MHCVEEAELEARFKDVIDRRHAEKKEKNKDGREKEDGGEGRRRRRGMRWKGHSRSSATIRGSDTEEEG